MTRPFDNKMCDLRLVQTGEVFRADSKNSLSKKVKRKVAIKEKPMRTVRIRTVPRSSI